MNRSILLFTCLALLAMPLMLGTADTAAASTVFLDTFDVPGDPAVFFDINQDTAGRQSGTLSPIGYVSNTADNSNDYHHQVFAPAGPLQLAADGFITAGKILASPNFDFSGLSGGNVIGKRISFDLDVFANSPGPGNNTFSNAAITVGASSPLTPLNTDGFSVTFVEDNFVGAGFGNFLQFSDGSGGPPVQNLIPNPAGAGPMNVMLDIDDPTDGNPWDGIGQTTITVSVNGTQVGTPFTQGGGGYTSNYVTFEGFFDSVNFGLAIHNFDNFKVEGLPIPEPATALLAGMAVTGMAIVIRRKR